MEEEVDVLVEEEVGDLEVEVEEVGVEEEVGEAGDLEAEIEEALEEAGVGGSQKVRHYLEDQKHLYTANLYILDIEKQWIQMDLEQVNVKS